MNTQSNAVPESSLGSQASAPAAMPPTRPIYWSVRRELWENRSITIAPLAVAAVILFGFLIGAIHPTAKMRAALVDPTHQRAAIHLPYDIAAFLIFLTAFTVGVFYCLDALHGERRDRSILFWKSLPVSDLTTVLSKASIPLVVLPMFIFAVIITTQVIMLLLNTAVLLANGVSAATLWAQLPLFQMELGLLYCLTTVALWHAPIYGWLLLVSGWARRAAFLWAVLPLFAICVGEKIAFNTSHFANLLKYRLIGWFMQALVPPVKGSVAINPLTQLMPGKFLSTPGLWLGLAVAAIFLAAAVRLRRYSEPI
ncbi:MAG: ABC transporter permease [Terriglobia bacterium]